MKVYLAIRLPRAHEVLYIRAFASREKAEKYVSDHRLEAFTETPEDDRRGSGWRVEEKHVH